MWTYTPINSASKSTPHLAMPLFLTSHHGNSHAITCYLTKHHIILYIILCGWLRMQMVMTQFKTINQIWEARWAILSNVRTDSTFHLCQLFIWIGSNNGHNSPGTPKPQKLINEATPHKEVTRRKTLNHQDPPPPPKRAQQIRITVNTSIICSNRKVQLSKQPPQGQMLLSKSRKAISELHTVVAWRDRQWPGNARATRWSPQTHCSHVVSGMASPGHLWDSFQRVWWKYLLPESKPHHLGWHLVQRRDKLAENL